LFTFKTNILLSRDFFAHKNTLPHKDHVQQQLMIFGEWFGNKIVAILQW